MIVEIKKPGTRLTEGTKSSRNGAWLLGKESVIGVAQVQANCELWAGETSKLKSAERWLRERGIRVIEPKGVLVVGNFADLKDGDARATDERIETFERFRRSLANPEILTYDELLARAKALLALTKPARAEDPGVTVTDGSDDGRPDGDDLAGYEDTGPPAGYYEPFGSIEFTANEEIEEREPDPDDEWKERRARPAPPRDDSELDDLPF